MTNTDKEHAGVSANHAVVNGEPYQAKAGETVKDLVEAQVNKPLTDEGVPVDGSKIGVAVAVDGAVVPRARWATTEVAGTIDIVTAVQGG